MVGYEYICVSWRVSWDDACKVIVDGEALVGGGWLGLKRREARSLESDMSRTIFHARDTS